MITLYHAAKTRSLRPLWMLEEMGLDYAIVPVTFPPMTRDRGYLKVNPLGTLPTMVDGGTRIFESVGIVDYLARRYGPTPLAPAPDDPMFGDYLQYLHLGEAGLSGPLTYLLHARVFGPEGAKDNWSLRDIRKTFGQRLRLVVRQLEKGTHMAGEAFTAADISVGYALLMARWIGADEAFDGRIEAYLERITAREAYRRAMAR